ncbi:enhanced serine sensitivity protein SseB C-terminal domain-containing protein [Actinoplanes palleronii]|uniref:Enhanced serine sensitivity protein SseB n=1 Tax=Actinoplanes palleronii TaxID=113570 RepID=A0ABQ4BRN0_9ACTN|nr:enhanced serine sensitivity protein SseB C-terminal domain-containing protein [Actinoplanes palleronii]GIE73317.1 enhanced serine sensitivity protein SseB [Actinoplanes palleronii]
MTFPANTLESVLADTRAGTATGEQLLHALRENDLWVPLPAGAQPGGDATLPIMTLPDGPYVAVFTSAEQFGLAASGEAHMVLPGRELAALLSPELGLAVNPGGAIGLPIRASGVDEIRGGERRVAAGSRMRLGLPVEEPHELLAALAGAFAALPAVLEARLALGKVGDQPPALLIGVLLRAEGDMDQVFAAVREVTARVTSPFPVDTVVLRPAGDPLTDWLTANTEPFFPAG